jgi:hypothetical protein
MIDGMSLKRTTSQLRKDYFRKLLVMIQFFNDKLIS